MPAADLRWYDTSDVEIEAVWDYPDATPATPTAGTTRRLYNDFGGTLGSDDATNYHVQVLASLDGLNPYYSAGLEPLDDYWVEARVKTGTLGGYVVDADGPWTALGPGKTLTIPTLASGEGVAIEFRLNVPMGTTTAAVHFNHALRQRRSVPVPAGLFRTAGNGVHLGLGEWNRSGILQFAGVLENPAGADADVLVSDLVMVGEGRHIALLEALTTLNATAADGALGGGESYIALVYVTDAFVVATEKGDGAASPTEPAVPADALLDASGNPLVLAAVTVDETAVNSTADIDNRYTLDAGGLQTTSLSATIGPERSIVGDRLVEPTTVDTVALTASVTRKVWRRTDGSLAYSAAPPTDDPWADPRYELTTDGSGVTASRDLRRFMGFGHELVEVVLRIDGPLTAGLVAYGKLPKGRNGQLLPLVGIDWLFDTVGAGTSLATILDVNYANPGGAFATIFTSQGTDDRRPTIAFDATVLYGTAQAEVVDDFEGDCRFQLEVDAVPAGGAGPDGATVTLRFALTG